MWKVKLPRRTWHHSSSHIIHGCFITHWLRHSHTSDYNSVAYGITMLPRIGFYHTTKNVRFQIIAGACFLVVHTSHLIKEVSPKRQRHYQTFGFSTMTGISTSFSPFLGEIYMGGGLYLKEITFWHLSEKLTLPFWFKGSIVKLSGPISTILPIWNPSVGWGAQTGFPSSILKEVINYLLFKGTKKKKKHE